MKYLLIILVNLGRILKKFWVASNKMRHENSVKIVNWIEINSTFFLFFFK